MFNVKLGSDHLYGKWLFTWLSLVISLMVSHLVLSFFQRAAWMRSGTKLCQFLRIVIPTFVKGPFSHEVSWGLELN